MLKYLVLASAMALGACGYVEVSDAAKTTKRTDPGGSESPSAGTGRIALRMPKEKPGKTTKTLEVYVSSESVCHDWGGGTEGSGGGFDGSDDGYDGPDDIFIDLPEVDAAAALHKRIPNDWEGGGYCEPGMSQYMSFPFEPGALVEIPGLRQGQYFVTVNLLDETGSVSETGEGGAYVRGGEQTFLQIVLRQVQEGGLVIDIVREGEDVPPAPKPEPEPLPFPSPDPTPPPAPVTKPKKG